MTDGKGPDRDPVSSTGYPLAFYRCGIPIRVGHQSRLTPRRPSGQAFAVLGPFMNAAIQQHDGGTYEQRNH